MDRRSAELEQQTHRRSHEHGDRFGMAQGQTFGHQLADDHGAVGDTKHYDAKSERSTVGSDHRERAQSRRRPLGKTAAAKGTGQDADESYAELNRGEKR